MPRGGPRFPTGRRPGSKNKSTIEREKRAAEEAARELADARAGRRRLPKDILEQMAATLFSMTAYYAPIPPGQPVPANRGPDEGKFLQYAELTIYAAAQAAKYFHPTFKGHHVSLAPDQTGMPGAGPGIGPAPGTPAAADAAKPVKGEVIDLKDPKVMLREYQKMINGK